MRKCLALRHDEVRVIALNTIHGSGLRTDSDPRLPRCLSRAMLKLNEIWFLIAFICASFEFAITVIQDSN